ncbi:KAP family NTPase [Exiguobacterium sp. s157]|uniref:KAP family NTPase n=1 Tax=Exiguobacterium sp. s157 TaxID=2751233 RepID=UPI001BE91C1B|nr:KAP family NTPase [Exiguobacterium sp. s157]
MKANELLNVLKELNTDITYNRVFITGPWGIGKSKYIQDFVDIHPEVSYLSLFGKKNIQEITEELYLGILKHDKYGEAKTLSRKIRKSLSSLNIGPTGVPVSIAVPLIGDVYEALSKKLELDKNFFIIFDDLERKHDNLDLKEVFGLIDRLSKFKNVKIILVADEENFLDQDNDTFQKFHEKSIDKIYKITAYATDAPQAIFQPPIWEAIGEIEEIKNIKNLRILIKIKNFIEDVNNQISKLDLSLNENFSFHDLYRICAGIIIFVVDLNKSMPRIKENSNLNPVLMNSYDDTQDGHVNYIGNQILNRSFENALFQNLIKPLLVFYETGEWDDNLTESTRSIINYKEKPVNFFSSEAELREVIENSKINLTNFDSTKDLHQLITEISIAIEWSVILAEDYGFTNEEIMIFISPYLTERVKVETPLRESKIDHMSIGVSNSKSQELIRLINNEIEAIYADLIFKSLEECIDSKNYQWNLFDCLIQVFHSSKNREHYREVVIESEYFFPIPDAKISEAHWTWCHKVKHTMNSLNLGENFSDYLNELITIEQSPLTRHRLKILLGNS